MRPLTWPSAILVSSIRGGLAVCAFVAAGQRRLAAKRIAHPNTLMGSPRSAFEWAIQGRCRCSVEFLPHLLERCPLKQRHLGCGLSALQLGDDANRPRPCIRL